MKMTTGDLAALLAALAAIATSIAVIIMLKPKRPENELEVRCTCKCGSKYYKIKTDEVASCHGWNGYECVDQDGEKHKLEDCGPRMAFSGGSQVVVA